MSILVDTNVLLRRTQPGHPHHIVAMESVDHLLSVGKSMYFTLQNIAEFWCVATRPIASNGLGFSTEMAANEIDKIERSLTLLTDLPSVYIHWRQLVSRHNVSGVKVHDARLVASMNAHSVRQILTFNAGDFIRYGI